MVTMPMHWAWGGREGQDCRLNPIQIQFTALIDEVPMRPWGQVHTGLVAQDRSSSTVQATSEPDSGYG